MPPPVGGVFIDARYQTRDNTPTGGFPHLPAHALMGTSCTGRVPGSWRAAGPEGWNLQSGGVGAGSFTGAGCVAGTAHAAVVGLP